MALMDKDTEDKVRESLLEMEEPVHILVFTEKDDCSMCADTKKIVEEVSNLGNKVTFTEIDVKDDKEVAEKYGIDKVPAIIPLKGTEDNNIYPGIRFFGIPAGYEFTSFLDSILTISHGIVGLSDEGKEYLESLDKDIHLQVFVTPTCPYCPRAVVLAHHMALVSDRITSDMVEAQEFPEMTQKYKVMGVPRTVINEVHHQEGAAPENMILDLIKKV
jgi:glutaredoxin-like protein